MRSSWMRNITSVMVVLVMVTLVAGNVAAADRTVLGEYLNATW